MAVAALVAGVVAIGGAGAAGARDASELVVMVARGLALGPGDVIPADQPVTLSDGQALTLIESSGRIVDLTGPFTGLPMPAAPESNRDVLLALKDLVRGREADTSQMGVTRAFRITPPDIWVMDVTTSGPRCLREDAPVVLWRADASQDLTVILSSGGGAWSAGATWLAGETELTVPPTMPVADGGRLTVAVPGGEVDLELHPLPASLPTDAARLAWMIRVGCEAQAAMLARRLP